MDHGGGGFGDPVGLLFWLCSVRLSVRRQYRRYDDDILGKYITINKLASRQIPIVVRSLVGEKIIFENGPWWRWFW